MSKNRQYWSRQTVESHYVGPTDTKGARIIATTVGGARLVVDWDYELSPTDNHVKAMKALAIQLNWLDETGMAIVGTTKKGFCLAFFDTCGVVTSPLCEWALVPMSMKGSI